MAVSPGFFDLQPGRRWQTHPLHGEGRIWPETNCYVDLWIEVLAALGFDPAAALAFTVTQDFEGDHFTFFKFPLEDLAYLFDLQVQELALYDELEGHLEQQIALKRLPLIEIDSFYLPDTRGVSYQLEHTKTSIAVHRIDRAGRRLEYVHGLGLHVAEGNDYDGLFRRLPAQQATNTEVMFPYAEFVKLPLRRPRVTLLEGARYLLQHRLPLRPERNPIVAFRQRLEASHSLLATRPMAFFHKYAFNTVRQLGANFELLAAHVRWLSAAGEPGLAGAEAGALAIAEGAKTLQFQMARSFAKKRFEPLFEQIGALAPHYDAALGPLIERYAT